MGLTVGIVLSVLYRHEGPGPTRFINDMEEEEEEEEDEEDLSEREPEKTE
jgi:hypothetical protein